MRQGQYAFEEICLKTLYNETAAVDSFDSDSPYYLVPFGHRPGATARHSGAASAHAVMQVAGTPEYGEMRRRDVERRSRAMAILQADAPADPADWYHAAWLFNHGDTPSEAEAAFRLAARSVASGYAPARWLYAAAYDRWCTYCGRAQKFGTQIVPDGKTYRVWDVDPTTTDEECAVYDVPPLAEQQRRAAEESRTFPQPPMDLAPEWLKRALVRWARAESAEPAHTPDPAPDGNKVESWEPTTLDQKNKRT